MSFLQKSFTIQINYTKKVGKMKKLFIFSIFIIFCQLLFSSPNYNNGNGTIESVSEKDGIKTTIRKCEIDNVIIGNLLYDQYRTIYKNYDFSSPIGNLKDNDKIKVLQTCTHEYLDKPKIKGTNFRGEIWYKIQYEETIGWICINMDSETLTQNPHQMVPYDDNDYEILEIIESAGKKWTIRKLGGLVAVWERLNVRDKPGLGGKKIFLLHDYETGSPGEFYTIFATTEETEKIDGLPDHWLKIEYAPNKYGWIFGGYTTVERGGPKYYTPENIVLYDLIWF